MATKAPARSVPRLARDLPALTSSLSDEAEIAGVTITGDHSGADLALVEIEGCIIERARLTGGHLSRSSLVDCTIDSADLSGLTLEDCRVTRVELRDCRVSGLQVPGSRFTDVAFIRCKIDGANFRGSSWERAEFEDCSLVEADFYGTKLAGTHFYGCDLRGAELSKADLRGSRLHRSTLDSVSGAESLRGATIGTDQMIAAALAVFRALDITVDDGDTAENGAASGKPGEADRLLVTSTPGTNCLQSGVVAAD